MLRHVRHITLWLLFALMCTSCTGVHDLREARSTVAAADSLRAASGALYNDSTALAFAVTTLEPVRLLFPTDYAHANYYYGRLLREAGDQPEAMLAFLRAVHSRTNDHEIKARSWSNMGTMCHWAEEYALAYTMYEQCAEHFYSIQDSTNYYYALNAMAYELADNSNKLECQKLINLIEDECTSESVLAKIWETRAEMYLISAQYDSAIYCVRMFQEKGCHDVSGYVIKAQAFSYLCEEDSAVYYAKIVMDAPNATFQNKYNVLFILEQQDKTIDSEEIKRLSAERSDIDSYHLDPLSASLQNAIQLLKQSISHKPDLRWLYAVVFTLLILSISTSIYIKKQKSKNLLLFQQAKAAREEHRAFSEQVQLVRNELSDLRQKRLYEIQNNCNALHQSKNWKKDLHWDNYVEMCEIINEYFFLFADKLKGEKELNEKEFRLCVLVVIGFFSDKEMADILCYGENSIRGIKRNVALKLGTTSKKLRDFLLSKIV